jgi:hypothetical protein
MLGSGKCFRVRFLLIGGLIMMLALTGCGRNALGPTAPTLNAASSVSLDSDEDNVLGAECTGPGSHWTASRVMALLKRFVHHGHIQSLGERILQLYITDPAVRSTVWNVLTSKPFRLVFFEWGLGARLVKDCLRILAYSWYPGLGSTQNGFTPEVTLLPFAWSPAGGFNYPNYLSGWHNGAGFLLESVNPAGHVATLNTFSEPGIIYHNENNLNHFYWQYTVRYPDPPAPSDWIQFDLNTYGNRITLDSSSMITQPGKVSVSFEDVWAATLDRSAKCYLSDYFGALKARFDFIADGSGSGYLEMPSKHGVVRYDLVHFADGHGYWTKNGGKRHRY